MFKALTYLIAVAAVASNAQNINSGSSNSGLNVASLNSNVVQHDIQNVNAGAGWGPHYGGHLGYAGYLGYPGYVGHAYYPGYYGYDAPLAYGYGYAGILPHYGYAGHINSASSNVGANIQSVHSDVLQNHIQNVNRY